MDYACDSPTEQRWFHMKVLPFQGRKGGVIVTHSDITERRQAEEKAKKHREELIHVGRATMMGDLSASIAHELNQPLTGILSNAQAGEMLLKRGDGNRIEIEEILTDIINDSKRSGDILRNLRDLFSRQKIESKLLGINAVVEETIRLMNSEFVIQGMNIRMVLSDTLPDVTGNRVQIQQVLINLINNAKQAMQQSAKAGGSISIVTSRGNEGEVQVDVEDTGPGIDQDQLEGIFEPLNTWKPGGLGMGLSISSSIIQAHGGRIWAENRPAGGARVSFTLPAGDRPAAEMPTVEKKS
jgi:C4-dicarboxylate-specific signal transduction histidine kinase